MSKDTENMSCKLRFCSLHETQVVAFELNKDCECINCPNGLGCNDNCPTYKTKLINPCMECLLQKIR